MFSTTMPVAMPMAAPRIFPSDVEALQIRITLTERPITAATAVATMTTFWFSVMASMRGVGPTAEL